tara:strand:+ start:389 stop:1765 length:1377 start_codon:yes stop_codon:yes gene_type:complete
MFESLGEKLSSAFKKLKGKGVITETTLNDAMREIRIALLEADVALEVSKSFIQLVKEKALGKEVLKSVDPAQMVVKIVNDELIEILGSENYELNLKSKPPAILLLAGLQGSGKTTSAAKLAKRITKTSNKKVLMASLDVYRPAAQEQLEILGNQNQIQTLKIIKNQKPLEIAERAVNFAKSEFFDVLILDSAGRNQVDDKMMKEIVTISKKIKTTERLLVVDSMAGQDAVNTAKHFNTALNLTGIVLTRVDGDSRGGAALSMKSVAKCPIKFIGVGEKVEDLEEFHPDRIANRILGMGDVVTLVEKAHEEINEKEAEDIQKRFLKGKFTLNDYSKQLSQISKMGGIGGLLKYLPGLNEIKNKIEESNEHNEIINIQNSIISSMTKKERIYPELIKASRKKRISLGSGRSVQEINKLLKQFKKMSQMVKKVGKNKQLESMLKSGDQNNIQSMLTNNKFL